MTKSINNNIGNTFNIEIFEEKAKRNLKRDLRSIKKKIKCIYQKIIDVFLNTSIFSCNNFNNNYL